jgi:hypothetical protein
MTEQINNTLEDLPAPNGEKKVSVKLTGKDGNAFAIMAFCSAAMRKAKWTQQQITNFTDGCMNQESYYALIRFVSQYCKIS